MTNAKRGSIIAQNEPSIDRVVGVLALLNEGSGTGRLEISRLDAAGQVIGKHTTDEIDFKRYVESTGQVTPRGDVSIAERAAAATRYVTTSGLDNEAER